jgi:hypothetical protein
MPGRDREKAGPGEQRARERGLGAGKDQGEILAANTRGFPRASAGPARESGDSSPSQGRAVKRADTRPSLARDARSARPRRAARSVCAGGLAEARELPTPGREVARLHSRSSRASVPACKRPAEAGRSRKAGKTNEHRSPELALPTVAPPEGIEPSLLRHTPGAHSVNSPCRDPHTFTPCRTAVRIALTVTEAGAPAPYLSRKGSE